MRTEVVSSVEVPISMAPSASCETCVPVVPSSTVFMPSRPFAACSWNAKGSSAVQVNRTWRERARRSAFEHFRHRGPVSTRPQHLEEDGKDRDDDDRDEHVLDVVLDEGLPAEQVAEHLSL